MERYHQLFSDATRQQLGRFVFGTYDISPVEYIPAVRDEQLQLDFEAQSRWGDAPDIKGMDLPPYDSDGRYMNNQGEES